MTALDKEIMDLSVIVNIIATFPLGCSCLGRVLTCIISFNLCKCMTKIVLTSFSSSSSERLRNLMVNTHFF